MLRRNKRFPDPLADAAIAGTSALQQVAEERELRKWALGLAGGVGVAYGV